MKAILRVVLVACYLVWMAAWFWAFTFAYSSSFFEYHLDTRLPILGLALLAVAVPPLSGYWVVVRSIRRGAGIIRLLLLNLGVTALPIAIFWAVITFWVIIARSLGSRAFEADEAMGNGIDFMLCVAVFVISNAVVAAVAIAVKLRSRGPGFPEDFA